MTEHADHRFSATLSSPDLALIGCLRALAEFSEETGNGAGAFTKTRWKKTGARLARRSPSIFQELCIATFSKTKCGGFCLQTWCALTPKATTIVPGLTLRG
jgi:hypothetical protein